MVRLLRFVFALLVTLGVAVEGRAAETLGDADFDSATASVALAPSSAAIGPKVYVFRAMGGNLATPEMDKLAGKVMAQGIAAEVHSYIDWIGPANEAIARYKAEPAKSPIIAVGHSAGGDSAIRFAQRLKGAGIPVDLIVTIDPTRIVGRVPGNVERFVNIYCSSNALGGGDPKPARDFRGHFASVDLKNYPNVWHVYLPRITGLQDKIVAKIVEVTARPDAEEVPTVAIEYRMPRGEPLELWDSGVPLAVEPGDTPALIAAKYGLPPWLVAEVNHIDPAAPLPAGREIVLPRRLAEAAPAKP